MTELLQNHDRFSSLRPLFSRLFPDRVTLDFTVAIPTYNGSDRLPTVLSHLAWQLSVNHISWEIIVVDNNSTDNTAAVVRDWQSNPLLKVPLRYEFEPRQGAGYARCRAVQTALSPLIGFLDDDNFPAMNWVAAAYAFAQAHPQAGVIASRIRGDFEVPPPANFSRIAPLLALTDRGHLPRQYQGRVIPPSAGMVVRKAAWMDNVPEEPVLTGRAGSSMLTGEDTEAVLHIQNAGWQVWYNPQMRLQHKIPQARLTRAYLTRLCLGIGFSRCRTRMLSVKPGLRLPMLLLYALNDVRKIGHHLLKHGRAAWQDDVAACELALYMASLVSPAYLLRYRLATSSDLTRDGGQ